MSRADSLSVVVVLMHGANERARLFEAVRSQVMQVGAELIAVVSDLTDLPSISAERQAIVRVPRDASMPERRAAGLAQAVGEWVCLTETPCVPDEHWLTNLVAAMAEAPVDVDALGGAVGIARSNSSVARAAFFAEYGIYGATRAVTLPDGTPHIAAANVAYRRRALRLVIRAFEADEGEPVLHMRLRATGHRFQLVPSAIVRCHGEMALVDALHERFEHGCDYALLRRIGHGRAWRFGRALSCVALSPLLTWRIYRAVESTSRTWLLAALPTMLLLLASWASGEAVGYLRAEHALRRTST